MKQFVMRCCGLFALLMSALFIVVQPASAHGVVGTGSPESCTEAAFDTALAGGGVVTFNCGNGPLTLPISATKLINAPTTIDGGGRITIRGNGTFRLFEVKTGVPIFEIKNLILTDGHAGKDDGGVVTATESKLLVINSTITDSRAGYGGAILCCMCKMTVLDSTFSRNHASKPFDYTQFSLTGGGAIYLCNRAEVTITNSQFSENTAVSDGGAIADFGSDVKIVNSVFTANSARNGGAILNSRGDISITGSRFLGNKAKSGEAISCYRYSLDVTDSTFTDNGIANTSCSLTSTNNTYNSNTATPSRGQLPSNTVR